MAFTANHDNISGTGRFQGPFNCLPSIQNRFNSCFFDTAFYFIRNIRRVFTARIISGNNDQITVLVRNFSHNRPFFFITITTTAENGNQLFRIQCLGHFQNIVHPIRRMRIIDNNRKILAFVNQFKTTGNNNGGLKTGFYLLQ